MECQSELSAPGSKDHQAEGTEADVDQMNPEDRKGDISISLIKRQQQN